LIRAFDVDDAPLTLGHTTAASSSFFRVQLTYNLLGLVPRIGVLDVNGEINQQRVWQRPLHKILDDGLRFIYCLCGTLQAMQ
jgi:hypothetical protein